jgi:hypothetical protein
MKTPEEWMRSLDAPDDPLSTAWIAAIQADARKELVEALEQFKSPRSKAQVQLSRDLWRTISRRAKP